MISTHLTITLYSHHFSATRLSGRGRYICDSFALFYLEYGFIPTRGKMVKTALRVFAASTVERDEYRFHINQLPAFEEHLTRNNIIGSLVERLIKPMFEPAKVEFKVKEGWAPKDYQLPLIDYLVQDKPVSKLLGLQTGKGKSASCLFAMSQIGTRTVFIIKPGYIEKWIGDISKQYEIDKDDIMTVQGGQQLMSLLQLAKENKITEKIIIISNKTFQIWLKAYEKYKEESLDIGYACYPHEMHEQLKSGLRVIDEVHQDFHLNFKIDLYTHVKSSISLSATLITNNPFIYNMQKIAYPLGDRCRDIPLDKYIDSYSLIYRFNNPDMIKTTEYGSNNYSHNAVEKSIMKHIPTLNNYLALIDYSMQISFLAVKRPKKKLLLFAYTVDLIDIIVDYLKRKYPQFDTRRYVGEDDYADLIESDIAVSTLGSSGTAHDLADLTTVILTPSVDSLQANVQSLGRLRKLNDGYPVQFLYLVCLDIPKSLQYDKSKRIMLAQRAKSFREIHTGYVV
jgi:superfamily II DNA or RNA helicase